MWAHFRIPCRFCDTLANSTNKIKNRNCCREWKGSHTYFGEFDSDPRIQLAQYENKNEIDTAGRHRGYQIEHGLGYFGHLRKYSYLQRDSIGHYAQHQRDHQAYLSFLHYIFYNFKLYLIVNWSFTIIRTIENENEYFTSIWPNGSSSFSSSFSPFSLSFFLINFIIILMLKESFAWLNNLHLNSSSSFWPFSPPFSHGPRAPLTRTVVSCGLATRAYRNSTRPIRTASVTFPSSKTQ